MDERLSKHDIVFSNDSKSDWNTPQCRYVAYLQSFLTYFRISFSGEIKKHTPPHEKLAKSWPLGHTNMGEIIKKKNHI